MNYSNSKEQTIKIPRKIHKFDEEHVLDVLLACAHYGSNPASEAERTNFRNHILNSPDSEFSQQVKNALLDLSEEEQRDLFR